MSTLGQQKLLSYQYLPITSIQLHTQLQLKTLKLKSILSDNTISANNKMLQYFNSISHQTKQLKNQPQNDNQVDFKKWAKQVDKICGHHVKLTQVQKIQLFNNAITKIITSEPQLVLILSKLHALTPKDRKLLLQKCTFQ